MRMPIAALVPLLVLAFTVAPARGEGAWKAGVASIIITPDKPVWLTGFQARTGPSRGTLHDLFVKALVLEDSAGHRSVLVTSDLLGFPAEVADDICRQVTEKYGMPRERIFLNSSHTHGAPAIASPVQFIYGPRVSDEQRRDIEAYTEQLKGKVVGVIGTAIESLAPAKLSFGQGEATFGVNRRVLKPDGRVQGFTPNPDGPVDRAVPVLRVDGSGGKLRAIVFGYAAHPTTITTGNDYYKFSGDYPAFAQQSLEAAHPGAVAMFVQGCGGDVMVFPRGSLELAKKYGNALAESVEATLAKPGLPVEGPISAAIDRVPLEFATPLPSRESLEAQAKDRDPYFAWHARDMLAKLERNGTLPSKYEYPIQAWQFGDSLTLVALAGEVVADYSLQLKKTFATPEKPVWVAGYSNDLCCYIPTRKVLAEGGYEADRSMIYYMQPSPWSPSIEDAILGKANELVGRVRGDQ